jgi:hypothetical protein
MRKIIAVVLLILMLSTSTAHAKMNEEDNQIVAALALRYFSYGVIAYGLTQSGHRQTMTVGIGSTMLIGSVVLSFITPVHIIRPESKELTNKKDTMYCVSVKYTY